MPRLVFGADGRREAVLLTTLLAAAAAFIGAALGTGWALHLGLVRKRRPYSPTAATPYAKVPSGVLFRPDPDSPR